LKKLGYQTAIISGGFTTIAEKLGARLGIDRVFANQLEFGADGNATGKVALPIVNAQRKADLLEQLARETSLNPEQVIAIGDGANDLLMLERAGLGIAFNAKPVVREKADTSLNTKGLDAILHLLGISKRDL
jgi:phosphoserine phosphatase